MINLLTLALHVAQQHVSHLILIEILKMHEQIEAKADFDAFLADEVCSCFDKKKTTPLWYHEPCR